MPYDECRYWTHDALRIYYRRYNGATRTPVILCLGGISRNSKDFHEFACHQQSLGRSVICPDYRGRGQSDYARDPKTYNLQSYILDIHALIAQEQIHQMIVVGTSMGGLLATALSLTHATLVRGTIINDIGPIIPDKGAQSIAQYIGVDHPHNTIDDGIAMMQEIYGSQFEDPAMWRRLAQNTFRQGDDNKRHIDWDPRIASALTHKNRPRDYWKMFDACNTRPTLIIRGALSQILPEDLYAKMQARWPAMQFCTVAKCGHAPMLDEADAAPCIDAFLETIYG